MNHSVQPIHAPHELMGIADETIVTFTLCPLSK
jgi:hypothetical protein